MAQPKIAINGFGRIGRTTFRVMLEKELAHLLVGVNDLTDAPTLAHLLKYDSNYGVLSNTIKAEGNKIKVDNYSFEVLAEKDPEKLPWAKLGIDIVLECTGRFTDPEKAKAHLKAGAKRVIISAPAKGEGASTFVLGVNDDKLQGNEEIISNASCTTNCITPVAQIIHSKFGILKAMMTTVHAYTADQNLQDGPHRDLRRARSAAINIVPTTTGATKAAAKTIPELQGIFSGLSIRVPVPVVSLSDFTFVVKKKTTKEEVNQVLRKAALEPRFKNILAVTEEPVVSSDIVKSPYSAVVDLSLTQVIGEDMVKVIAWYDNEWGYSCRLVELALLVAQKI